MPPHESTRTIRLTGLGLFDWAISGFGHPEVVLDLDQELMHSIINSIDDDVGSGKHFGKRRKTIPS